MGCKIVFIDEPETYLHPSQRRELGRLVAGLAKEKNKQVFIATHDSEFLGGLMSANPHEAKVFYLSTKTDRKEHSTYLLSDINKLTVRKSVFVAERILQSFFYQKTILCENENDRTFYEIAAVNYFPDMVQNINFVGLGGKGDVIKIQKKLESLGLRCGFIVDFDFLTDSDSAFVGEIAVAHNDFRSKFQNAVSAGKFSRKEVKRDGLKFLNNKDAVVYQAALKAVDLHKKSDFYIVPNGELESFTDGSSNLKDAIPYIQARKRTMLAGFLRDVLKV